MPQTAPESKQNAAKSYGAEVILTETDLLKTCVEIQRARDLTMVHPFDDPYIVAYYGLIAEAYGSFDI